MQQISIFDLLLWKGLFHEFLPLLCALLSMAYISVGYVDLQHIYRFHIVFIGEQKGSIKISFKINLLFDDRRPAS